jgi:acyl-CoA synthetase (AMP-forming)/AMP-acid ligase II/acyl carrier protein
LDTDITEALETLASSQPTAPALHAPGRRTLTYADLGAQIRYVRQRLGEWGVARGDVVAGVIPQRPELALACAAIPAAATFAPLSMALTPDRYVELLARLRPKLAIAHADADHPIREAARRCRVAVADLDVAADAPAGVFRLDLARPDVSLEQDRSSSPELAYVLSTSGTTGRPKLVPTTHGRLMSYAQCWGDWLQLGPDDVGCNILPMHHGHGLNNALMIPLLRGGSVVCLPEGDIDGFFAALGEYRLTWLTAVFSVHREILRRAPRFAKEVAGNRLRFIRVGSGRLEPHEIEEIERTFAAPVLVALIAQETFLITHDPPPPRPRKRGGTGVTLCNQVSIMNDVGEMCADGDVGEIVVRGPLVFDGYFDDVEATAAAFVDGWFRTGDLGRFDSDGFLFLVGRTSEMINRGGEKIAPVEIDALIESHPGVYAAATFGVPHPTLGQEIVAAVVKKAGATAGEAEILARVGEELGPLRTPRRIYFLDTLPRTDSGKVRRSELSRRFGVTHPAVMHEAPASDPPPTASPLEAALTGLWSSVLEVGAVGVDDDFFLLGGDSLRAVRLLTAVKSLFGIDLPVESMFRSAATVAGMARAIERANSNATVNRG